MPEKTTPGWVAIAMAALILLGLCACLAWFVFGPRGGPPGGNAPTAEPAGAGRPDRDVRTPRGTAGETSSPEITADTDEETPPEGDPVPEPSPVEPPPPPTHELLEVRFVGHVPPREVPAGYTELRPGEDPVIPEGDASGPGAGGMKPLPYWSRWARVPEKGTVTLAGHVRDAAGNPVPGAQVYRVRLDESGRRASPSSFQWVKEIAVTDVTGRYQAGGQVAGDCLVAADFNGVMRRPRGLDLTGAIPAAPGEGDTLTGLDIVLPVDVGSFVTVRGVVLDQDGRPIRKAQVNAPMQRIWTGPGGRFEVGGLPAGQVEIRVGSTGYATRSVLLDLPPGAEEEVEIRLELAEQGDRVLVGRVETVDGTPVPDAPVFLAASRGGSRWARTDAQGVFRFENLSERYAKQTVKVMVSPHPGRDRILAAGLPVTTTVPAASDLVLRVHRTVEVRILLRDAETDAPLRLANIEGTVEFTDGGATSTRQVTSQSTYREDGAFTVHAPAGVLHLVVRAKDHRGVEVTVEIPDTDRPKEVVLRMDPSAQDD